MLDLGTHMGGRPMKMESGPDLPAERQFSDVMCTGCGCLCDDLKLRIHAGKLDVSGVPCALGQGTFATGQEDIERVRQAPDARVAGQPVAVAEVLKLAAKRLNRARSPLIVGPTESSMEAQRAAVALADLIRAGIDTGTASNRWLARQRAGWVGATWGEIKQRADLIVFWDVDPGPVGPHPRFAERFLDPPGRFVPHGREGRTVFHIACWSDRESAIVIPPTGALAVLSGLRTLVRGGQVEAGAIEKATGQPIQVWTELVEKLKSAQYGVLVVGPMFDRHASLAECEGLERLFAELNVFGQGRFIGCSIGQGGNKAGLEAVLGWQAGAPGAVDFRAGFPRYLPREAEAGRRLAAGQVDVVVTIGPEKNVPFDIDHPDRPFWISIGHDATYHDATAPAPDLALATAHPWIEAGGTVMRGDGVTLPLTPLLEPTRPTDAQILDQLRRLILEQGASVP